MGDRATSYTDAHGLLRPADAGVGRECHGDDAILTGGQREIDLKTAGDQVESDRLEPRRDRKDRGGQR